MKHILRLPYIVLLLAFGGLTLYTYRELPGRAFAADDYQWLLSVNHLSPLALLQQAFDPSAQRHFYRPLVWAMIWTQLQLFGLNPAGFHFVSLALHLINSLLTGLLALRLTNAAQLSADRQRSAVLSGSIAGVLASGLVALHPAPFEAIVWISAQSELLGTCLLLLAIHMWLTALPTLSSRLRAEQIQHSGRKIMSVWWPIITATILLALAMLAKESAVLGLPLMLLLGWGQLRPRWAYLPPLILTLAFVLLQVAVGQQNRVLREGLYGIGPQLISNPLRSLALIIAPLPGTEHADDAWLVWAGLLVALALMAILISEARRMLRKQPVLLAPLIVAMLITLAPTAPFISPPDSRYLYLPVTLMAVLAGNLLGRWWANEGMHINRLPIGRSLMIICCCLGFWWGSSELILREWRFATGNGPGGSLWHLSTAICASVTPRRVILVEPPIAVPHAEAIIHLACGGSTQPMVVERAGLESALQSGSVVIGFPGGSATVERWI